jgi:enamine deaminase RidA (YjgF/YER057c/UK114 family)
MSFGYEEKDSRLAVERLEKILQQQGTSRPDLVFLHFYPLSEALASQIRTLRRSLVDPAHPPASTLLEVEGLPSMDAGLAMEAVAAKD